MKFLNAARQMPVVETLAAARPARSTWAPSSRAPPKPDKKPAKPVEYEFLPDAAGILEEIAAGVVQGAAVQVLPRRRRERTDRPPRHDESRHRKRRRHDQELDEQYNRARQAQITKEIAEIIGGAEALK